MALRNGGAKLVAISNPNNANNAGTYSVPQQKKKKNKNKGKNKGQQAPSKTKISKEVRRELATMGKQLRAPFSGDVVNRARNGLLGNNVYARALVDPERSGYGARIPDSTVDEETATYQAEFVFEVTGVSGTAVEAAGDGGRFAYAFNPIITAANFNAAYFQTTVMYADGKATTPTTQLWTRNYILPAAATNFWTVANVKDAVLLTSGASGLCKSARPVSMCVLASYVGNLIDGAGEITALLVKGGNWETMFTNGGTTNNLTDWEDVSTIPHSYNGPLSSGAYVWWKPDDPSDYWLRGIGASANSMQQHSYPTIVICGKNGNIDTTCLRIRAFINYEYVTESRVPSEALSPIRPNEMEEARMILQGCPNAMMNDQHIDWLKVLLGGLSGFVAGGPVGAAFGAAAGAGISMLPAMFTNKLALRGA